MRPLFDPQWSQNRPRRRPPDALNPYHAHLFDAQGQFIGLDATAGELRDKLGGLSEEQRNTALAVLFGTDAVRAASIMYDQGASDATASLNVVETVTVSPG